MSTMHERMGALVRGDPLPSKLEELQKPLFAVIEELADELEAASKCDPAENTLRERLKGDGSQTIAIMGQRGSGKTTLLAAVTAQLLRDERHLVVPIMRPDQFSETDSVITTFLAQLWDLLCIERDESGASLHADAIKLLADVSRGSAMARTTTGALEHGTESPTDYADDFVAVTRSGVRMATQLERLASHLCLPDDEQDRVRLIIVPIDDPDLARHDIISILTDLQVLSSVPGIVPVTCFSPEDLNGTWFDARQRLLPKASEKHLQFLLARQMEKAFPYRFRFEIEPIAPSQRPDFVPISETKPLREKMSVLRREVEAVSNCHWRFDEALAMGKRKFGLHNALPDNARTLVQLWETLDAIDDAQSSVDIELLHLTLRRMLSVLSEGVAARLGQAASGLMRLGSPAQGSDRVRILEIDFSAVNFFPGTTEPEEEISAPSLATFRLRKIHELKAVDRSEESGISGKYKPEDYLSGEETAALLALQDIAFGTGLFEITGTGLYMSNPDWRFLQTVRLANQVTDDTFLLLPDARGLSEVLRVAELWNQLAILAPGLSNEALLATTIDAACLTLDPDGELEACTDYDAAFDRAAALYAVALEGDGSTKRAFVQWFEGDLPLQWHSALLSGDRIQSLAYKHHELRQQEARQEYTHMVDSGHFENRLRLLLDSHASADPSAEEARNSWIAGYFEVASAFGSEQLERLSFLHSRWQRDSAGVRAGAATLGGLHPSEASRVHAAPYPTPEGTELQAAGIDALRRARRAARAEMQIR